MTEETKPKIEFKVPNSLPSKIEPIKEEDESNFKPTPSKEPIKSKILQKTIERNLKANRADLSQKLARDIPQNTQPSHSKI